MFLIITSDPKQYNVATPLLSSVVWYTYVHDRSRLWYWSSIIASWVQRRLAGLLGRLKLGHGILTAVLVSHQMVDVVMVNDA